MDEFLKVLIDITVYGSVLFALIYLKGFISNNRAFKYFTLYLLAVALVQMLMRLHGFIYDGAPNLHFFVYYFVSEFILLSLFYRELLGYKAIGYISISVLGFISIQYMIEPDMYFKYNPIGSSVTRIIIVGYSLLYLYKSLANSKGFLIVNIGVFIYFLSSVLIFATGNIALENDSIKGISNILSDVNSILYLVFQVLIIAEWWRNYRTKKVDVVN